MNNKLDEIYANVDTEDTLYKENVVLYNEWYDIIMKRLMKEGEEIPKKEREAIIDLAAREITSVEQAAMSESIYINIDRYVEVLVSSISDYIVGTEADAYDAFMQILFGKDEAREYEEAKLEFSLKEQQLRDIVGVPSIDLF